MSSTKKAIMKSLLQLGMIAMLATSFLALGNAFAVTNTCTTTNPCNYQVCGDHICSQAEFEHYITTMFNAQRGNVTTSTNTISGNIATTTTASTLFVGTMSYEDIASDGTLAIVSTNHPMEGKQSVFGIGFFTANGNPIRNQNYAITITQKNMAVFSDPNGFASTGINTIIIPQMPSSNDPLSLVLTLKGVGLATADPATWTGAKGETLDFGQGPVTQMNATAANMTTTTTKNIPSPEFGPVAPIVLTIAILSSIILATKKGLTTKS